MVKAQVQKYLWSLRQQLLDRKTASLPPIAPPQLSLVMVSFPNYFGSLRHFAL